MAPQPMKIIAWPRSDEPDSRYIISDHLPTWLRLWWQWTENGVAGWTRDLWVVIGWLIAVAGLTLLSPIALVGVLASAIVRHVHGPRP